MSIMTKAGWIPVLLLLLGARPAAGQSEIGIILDWINKLSGPQMGGVGASFATALPGGEEREDPDLRWRLAGILHFSYDEAEEIDPDDASVRMLTIRNAVEFPVRHVPLEFALGFSLHRFSGTDFSSFWHWSVPLRAQLRVPLDGTTLRFGPTLDIFPEFDDDDFSPLVVDVSTDGAEPVFGFFVALDFPL